MQIGPSVIFYKGFTHWREQVRSCSILPVLIRCIFSASFRPPSNIALSAPLLPLPVFGALRPTLSFLLIIDRLAGTPLHSAATSRRWRIICLLPSWHTEAEEMDKRGATPVELVGPPTWVFIFFSLGFLVTDERARLVWNAMRLTDA